MEAPVLDEAMLRQLIADLDASRVLEIFDIFSGEAEARVQLIVEHAPANDFEKLEHEAHAL